MKAENGTVCGMMIQQDLSGGQGHCWRSVAREDLPATIVEEIESAILDDAQDECNDYVASNGCHYRWK